MCVGQKPMFNPIRSPFADDIPIKKFGASPRISHSPSEIAIKSMTFPMKFPFLLLQSPENSSWNPKPPLNQHQICEITMFVKSPLP